MSMSQHTPADKAKSAARATKARARKSKERAAAKEKDPTRRKQLVRESK